MKEIKINIEGCMDDVAKVMKHLEQGGFLTQKNMSSGINEEGMNTTATRTTTELKTQWLPSD